MAGCESLDTIRTIVYSETPLVFHSSYLSKRSIAQNLTPFLVVPEILEGREPTPRASLPPCHRSKQDETIGDRPGGPGMEGTRDANSLIDNAVSRVAAL